MNTFIAPCKRSLNNPGAYVQLGNLRMAQKQLAEAQKAYQQALDQDPTSTDAMGGVLNVYLMQKQPDKAIAAAKAQISKVPKSAGFHIMLGQILMEQSHDPAGAKQEFTTAAELDKKNSEALIKLGLVQNLSGSPDQALQTFLEGSKINPNEITFYLLAGGIYESKKDWENAKQQYQKVLEIDRDNPLASNNLAYVMLQQGGNWNSPSQWPKPLDASSPTIQTPPTLWARLSTRRMSTARRSPYSRGCKKTTREPSLQLSPGTRLCQER